MEEESNGSGAPAQGGAATSEGASSRHAYAMVCSSNMNRSMEAHRVLAARRLRVRSFGTGTSVRLPGQSQWQPNVYQFSTTYSEIATDLASKDEAYYRKKGLLGMAERNLKIKPNPERWQDTRDIGALDVVFCFQERVFDALVEDVQCRDPLDSHPLHVINLEVTDNASEAAKGAQLALQFCLNCDASENLEQDMPRLVEEFENAFERPLSYALFYV